MAGGADAPACRGQPRGLTDECCHPLPPARNSYHTGRDPSSTRRRPSGAGTCQQRDRGNYCLSDALRLSKVAALRLGRQSTLSDADKRRDEGCCPRSHPKHLICSRIRQSHAPLRSLRRGTGGASASPRQSPPNSRRTYATTLRSSSSPPGSRTGLDDARLAGIRRGQCRTGAVARSSQRRSSPNPPRASAVAPPAYPYGSGRPASRSRLAQPARMGRVGWTSRLPGYPRRLVPRDEGRREGAPERTLTNLDNDRPQWLADALAVLDAAVAVPCG